MSKKNVAVIMGGYSSEFEISLQSGEVVCESLDPTIYNIYPVHIFKEGWYHVDTLGNRYPVDKGTFSFSIDNDTITPDVVFNTVHGTPGEDGYLASYFELLGIPHTSTGFYQAALSFNKRDSLTVLKNFGVKCANSVYITQGMEIVPQDIVDKVGLPCFVKPNRAGSSFGVSRVAEEKDLLPAIEEAYKEDFEVIIESELVGTEVSVGAYRQNNKTKVLSPTEIVSENDFFDYEAKYLGKSEEITPARIPENETKAVQEETLRIYELLNMKGVSRTDFIIQDGVPYFIEINTTPGLSKESIIPKQAREAGMTLTEFFGILVEEALQA
ncbi:D-alanine--D-alanine ligase [Aureisphaera galaxeae]|uniref:D-alanine--D-alanine ligase n=1 Tax=Aureisphaera galaxeae TaxID=1538023 RepID=UPI002350B5A5|nr:D-alanine--D-alanine ligase [Aureisphaera galaxeae]MDC8005477.1 D-alanine--D-alanine ligase [Aureisphaera galaxeae]